MRILLNNHQSDKRNVGVIKLWEKIKLGSGNQNLQNYIDSVKKNH